jgi:hypothetical protein
MTAIPLDSLSRSDTTTNSRARINAIKARKEALERTRNAVHMEPKEGNGWKMYEDKDDRHMKLHWRICCDLD